MVQTSETYLLKVPEAEVKIKMPEELVSGETLLLRSQTMLYHWVLTWPFPMHACGEGESFCSSNSSYKNSSPIGLEFHSHDLI